MMRLEAIQTAREIGISRQGNHNKIEWQKYAKSNKVHWDPFREDSNMEALAVLRHRRHLRGTRTRWDTDLPIDCPRDFQRSVDSQPTIFLYETGS